MCEKCDESAKLVANAREEILTIMNGGAIDCMLEDGGPSTWTEAAKMALVIARAATIIQHTDNGMSGAPLSMIIGSVAGVAMEAEMVAASMNEILHAIVGDEPNLN